jgi:2-dehydropantoate 2-reductase
MRYVVVGAGAVGGVIAAQLHRHGRDVAAVARGAHYEAITASGLSLETPQGTFTLAVPASRRVSEVALRDGDVVVLAVKSQDTLGVLRELVACAPPATPIVCAQNGLENERVALRHFAHVYGVCVMMPATHLAPGVVQIHAGPAAGVLDLGRWPSGVDELSATVAADLNASGFHAEALADVATLKWGKLLTNLANSIQALCGLGHESGELARRAHREALAVLAAAGVDGDRALHAVLERLALVEHRDIAGRERGGGSTWQSLARGAVELETDYLNGEIVLLGRLHGVPTPVNELLQRRAGELARAHGPVGALTERELLDQLD